jgi:hypothetical protein
MIFSPFVTKINGNTVNKTCEPENTEVFGNTTAVLIHHTV